MGVYAITAQRLELGGTDFSARELSATLEIDVGTEVITNGASSGWEETLPLIKSAKLNITVLNDYAASQIDSVVWAALGSTLAVKLRPTSSSIGATNPEFQFTVNVTQHRGGGDVGTAAKQQLSWPATGAVTRATS